jgi:hypothetical protein
MFFMANQNLRKSVMLIYLTALLIMIGYRGAAQPAINGPACIIPGTTYQYQYIITGKSQTDSKVRVCIAGGRLNDGNTCVSVYTFPYMLLIVWSDSAAERKIEVTSVLGNNSLIVSATTELNGSAVDNSDRLQVFNASQATYTFHCAKATGGSCTPAYVYQWQSSQNELNWTDIQGANGKNLEYSGRVTVDTYFRRVTTETHSHIVAYSGAGLLNVVFQ